MGAASESDHGDEQDIAAVWSDGDCDDDDAIMSGQGEDRPHFKDADVGYGEPLCLGVGPEAIHVNRNINRYLRLYQREGVRFLYELYRHGKGGILADDMGLVYCDPSHYYDHHIFMYHAFCFASCYINFVFYMCDIHAIPLVYIFAF